MKGAAVTVGVFGVWCIGGIRPWCSIRVPATYDRCSSQISANGKPSNACSVQCFVGDEGLIISIVS